MEKNKNQERCVGTSNATQPSRHIRRNEAKSEEGNGACDRGLVCTTYLVREARFVAQGVIVNASIQPRVVAVRVADGARPARVARLRTTWTRRTPAVAPTRRTLGTHGAHGDNVVIRALNERGDQMCVSVNKRGLEHIAEHLGHTVHMGTMS
jgi:hypothetical protein